MSDGKVLGFPPGGVVSSRQSLEGIKGSTFSRAGHFTLKTSTVIVDKTSCTYYAIRLDTRELVHRGSLRKLMSDGSTPQQVTTFFDKSFSSLIVDAEFVYHF